MAIHTIEEPYVKVRENIRDYPTILPREGECNIGGVIVAPTGPRLAYIAGPDEFLKTYTLDGNVPRNAHRSFLNAYYLSFASSLVIARSMNTSTVAGLGFKLANNPAGTKIPVAVDSISSFGLKLTIGNSSFIYGYTTGTPSGHFRKFISIQDCCTTFNNSINRAGITGVSLSGDEAYVGNIFITNTSGAVVTIGLETIDSIAPNGIVLGTPIEVSELQVLESTNLYYKGNQVLTGSKTLKLTFQDCDFDHGNYAFIIGSVAYYHGAVDRSMFDDYSLINISSADELATSLNGINGQSCMSITPSATNNGGDQISYDIEMMFSEGNEPYVVDADNQANVHLNVAIEDATPTTINLNNILFSIYPTNPASSNVYGINLKPVTETIFELTLTEGEKSNTFMVSLIADQTDNSGNNIYIERLNAMDINFGVSVNEDYEYSEDDYDSLEDFYYSLRIGAPFANSFGDSGLDISACKQISCITKGLYALEDQDQFDITYLATFGETNSQFVRAYMTVGKANNWFTSIDVPYNATNTNSIRAHFDNLPDDSNAIAVGPFDKNVGLTGWGFYLAPSTLYFEKVMANRATNKEYAPVFDETYGVINYTNPVCSLDKSDRKHLLNLAKPVNFMVYNRESNVRYFNNNLTHQSMRNIVSEENIRRAINEIKRVTPSIVKKYKGKMNTTSTRASVKSDIESWMRSKFIGTNYDLIVEYQVICDSTNNTVDVINSSQLAITIKVRLQGSIKYIDILVDCYPLGVDFDI